MRERDAADGSMIRGRGGEGGGGRLRTTTTAATASAATTMPPALLLATSPSSDSVYYDPWRQLQQGPGATRRRATALKLRGTRRTAT